MNIQKNLLKITGKCVLPLGVISMATVVIDTISGLIKEVSSDVTGSDLYVTDCVVLPGCVETHAHFRESTDGKGVHKEDFRTGSEAAINGGIVHVCEMGNNETPPCDEKSYGEKLELTRKSQIPITLYATVVKGGRPFRFRGSRVPYKVFMGPSIGNSNFETNDECENTVGTFMGEDVSSHCEDPHILRANKDRPTHEERRPEEAEICSIKFAIHLTRQYGIWKWKVCHVSTREGLRLIATAKKLGVPIICEGTHHHSWFNTLMLTDANRKILQMNPPIRCPDSQEAILAGLVNGDIDILAGDHAPHRMDEKNSPNGMSGVTECDTHGPFVAGLIIKHGVSLARIAEICSTNPGRFVNRFLPDKEFGLGYGQIAPGFVGSLTILDLNSPVTVTKEKLRTKCGWSPFTGVTFPGSVRHTIVRGKIYTPIMHD